MHRYAYKLWVARKKFRQKSAAPPGETLTVLVPGVQRSGTNMLMKVFERNSQTDVFHEWDSRAFDHYHLRPPPVIWRLRDTSRAPFYVLKALLNSDRTLELLDTLAPAKAIWMIRNVDDVVNSSMLNFPKNRDMIDEIVENPHLGGFRGWGMTDETHRILREAYRPDLNLESAKALFWYQRQQLFFDQALESDNRVFTMQYEKLAQAPVEEVRRICGFLGLPFEDFMVAHVHAKSVSKRKPANIAPHIRELCEGMYDRLLFADETKAALTIG